MSAPDFEDIDYDPKKYDKKKPGDDAENFCDMCCRLPFLTCVIIAASFLGLGYLFLSGNLLYQLLGVGLVFLVIGFFYYRYSK